MEQPLYKMVGIILLVPNDNTSYTTVLDSLKSSPIIIYEVKEGDKDLTKEEATKLWDDISGKPLVIPEPT